MSGVSGIPFHMTKTANSTGAAQREIRVEGAVGRRGLLLKRGKECFSKLSVTGTWRQGGSCRLLKRGKAGGFDFPLDFPHKGLPEKAFLKYLRCLAPHCHTSNLNPPPSTAQAVTLECLLGPEKYHPDREKSKEMREGWEGLLFPSVFDPFILLLQKQTVQPWLTDWLQGISPCWRSNCFSVWSANLMPSMIHNVVRSTPYL